MVSRRSGGRPLRMRGTGCKGVSICVDIQKQVIHYNRTLNNQMVKMSYSMVISFFPQTPSHLLDGIMNKVAIGIERKVSCAVIEPMHK
jgi:hypothetical protein